MKIANQAQEPSFDAVPPHHHGLASLRIRPSFDEPTPSSVAREATVAREVLPSSIAHMPGTLELATIALERLRGTCDRPIQNTRQRAPLRPSGSELALTKTWRLHCWDCGGQTSRDTLWPLDNDLPPQAIRQKADRHDQSLHHLQTIVRTLPMLLASSLDFANIGQ